MKKFAIGIDLGGTNLKGVIINRQGECSHLTRIPTEAQQGGARVLENILNLIETLIQKHGTKNTLLGIGLGTPGFVDGDGTILGGAENIPGWKGTNIYQPITERFGLGATAGNDVTVTALAEAKFGAGKGIPNIVCLALGTGIGGGIIIDGRVYMGTHGMAGELGHIPVETDGLQCSCGMRGCVEQYASGAGIVKNAKLISIATDEHDRTPFVNAVLADPESVTARSVYEYVRKGDAIACSVHEFICEKLAVAIGVICNVFAPDRVILGGGVMKEGRLITDTVSKYVPNYCWPSIWERCNIVVAQHGENAGVLGAGALVFEKLG